MAALLLIASTGSETCSCVIAHSSFDRRQPSVARTQNPTSCPFLRVPLARISMCAIATDHLVTALDQLGDEPAPDRTARSYYEDSHAVLLPSPHLFEDAGRAFIPRNSRGPSRIDGSPGRSRRANQRVRLSRVIKSSLFCAYLSRESPKLVFSE